MALGGYPESRDSINPCISYWIAFFLSSFAFCLIVCELLAEDARGGVWFVPNPDDEFFGIPFPPLS